MNLTEYAAWREKAMSEDDLLRAVLDMCRALHIRIHHCRPARTEDGRWYTPIQGDAGFVDLVLAGRRGHLFRELKSERGVPTPDQLDWINELRSSGADVKVWRPCDWFDGTIRTELEALARP